MPRVYVSIGSNVEREKNIRGALAALRERFGTVTASRVYECPAVGFDGADFYNLVAAFDTDESVEAVHAALAAMETAHGRTRSGPRFSPRTLDLDILLYGDLVRHDSDLDIPRDDIGKYAFVLGPLAEIAPALAHPETGVTLAEMWRRFAGPRRLTAVDIDGG
jgi:2-amino-4-hydroxy-6-hydroxymethyldihydropteridine diphosphokinase